MIALFRQNSYSCRQINLPVLLGEPETSRYCGEQPYLFDGAAAMKDKMSMRIKSG